MKFIERLRAQWKVKKSLVCVGLDPELGKIPASIRTSANPIFQFNKRIIDATAEFACAFKPQFAHYAAVGAEHELELTMQYIRTHGKGALAILDSKRGDIGSTAAMYATEAFERYEADAVTVNPYLGLDSLEPFLKHTEKGVIALCRTSNPGARDLQDLPVNGRKLYHSVAELAAKKWNSNGNLLLVVGATYPEELGEIRKIVGDMPILVPGVGAQGGDVAAVMKNGADSKGAGLIISSTRAIIYASNGADFAEAARKAAEDLRIQTNL